jgi:hypothetical protein
MPGANVRGDALVAIGALLLMPAGLLGQTAPAARFAGAEVCAGCHAEIANRQQVSNHALSLRTPSDIAELYRTLPFAFEDRSSQARLTLRSGEGNQLELESTKADGRAVLKLRWAFGSARRGITPVGIREDGAIVESRLSWFPFDGGYSLTPGATQADPQNAVESLGRSVTLDDVQRCFSCHTTDYQPTPSGPALHEMGIRCERCHGPGLEHARAMSGPNSPPRGADRKILNPGRLKTFSQLELCGACHGRPPLDTDVAALQYLEQTPQTARFPSRRLVLSRCYNESPDGLKCTLCHDPHGNVSDQHAQRDRSCMGCHTDRLSSKVRSCPVGKSGCVDCHMPRERVMIHSEFTDHWIRIPARRGASGGAR